MDNSVEWDPDPRDFAHHIRYGTPYVADAPDGWVAAEVRRIFIPTWRHPIRHIRGQWLLAKLIRILEAGPQ